MTRWFIHQATGAPLGPYPTDVVAQGLIDSKIGRDAYVAAEGDAQWQQITKVGEIVVATRKLQSAARAPSEERPAAINTVPPAPPPSPSAVPPVRVPKLPAMTIALYPAPPPRAPAAQDAPAPDSAPVPPPRTVPPPASSSNRQAAAPFAVAAHTAPAQTPVLPPVHAPSPAASPWTAPPSAPAAEPVLSQTPADDQGLVQPGGNEMPAPVYAPGLVPQPTSSNSKLLLLLVPVGIFGLLLVIGLAFVGFWLVR